MSIVIYQDQAGWVEEKLSYLQPTGVPYIILPHQPEEPEVEPSLVLAPAPKPPGLTRILLLGWFPLSLSLAAPPALEPRTTTTGNLSPS